jgi:hypothetical protein
MGWTYDWNLSTWNNMDPRRNKVLWIQISKEATREFAFGVVDSCSCGDILNIGSYLVYGTDTVENNQQAF